MSAAHGNPPPLTGEGGAGVALGMERYEGQRRASPLPTGAGGARVESAAGFDDVQCSFAPPPAAVGGADVESVSKADEGDFLAMILGNEVLAPLSRAVRGERQRRFMAAVATTINMFQVRVADMLYSFGQRVPTQSILMRHSATLEAATLIEVLCARTGALSAWAYSEQQQRWLKERLDVVAEVWEACEWLSGASVAMGAVRLGSTDAGSGG